MPNYIYSCTIISNSPDFKLPSWIGLRYRKFIRINSFQIDSQVLHKLQKSNHSTQILYRKQKYSVTIYLAISSKKFKK